MDCFYNPVHSIQGPGCTGYLPAMLEALGLAHRRVLLVVWGEPVLQRPVFSDLLHSPSYTVRSLVFAPSNPTVEQLFAAYQETRDFAPDAVVAVGGGSVLDVGKSLCCLYGRQLGSADALRSLIQSGDYGPSIPWIGIPTTAQR